MKTSTRSSLGTSLALLAALAALMMVLGGLFAGAIGVIMAAALTAGLFLLSQHAPVDWILRSQRAQPLPPWQAPEVNRIVEALARRAGLERAPTLYLSPGAQPNAFTIGEAPHAAIVLSAGLLRVLDDRELTGVLAHEIAHVLHRDTRLLRLAATFNAVVSALARAGWFMVLLSLPLVLFGQASIPLPGLLLLLLAPTLGQMLQLALSRTREYAADDAAVALTEDPRGLASALVRLEAAQRGLLGRLFGLGSVMVPEWMRTHPATEARVRRLLGASAPTPASPRPPHASQHAPSAATPRPRVRVFVTRGPVRAGSPGFGRVRFSL